MKLNDKKAKDEEFGLVEEFDFHYSIKKHGWTECKVVLNNTTIEFLISHVFSDPTYDLIDGLIKLVNRENEVKIVWYEEPGSVLWLINRNSKEHHKLNVCLKLLKNYYKDQNEDIFLEYHFQIFEDYFLKVIYCKMLQEYLLAKNSGHTKDRECFGFIEKFKELHRLLNYKI